MYGDILPWKQCFFGGILLYTQSLKNMLHIFRTLSNRKILHMPLYKLRGAVKVPCTSTESLLRLCTYQRCDTAACMRPKGLPVIKFDTPKKRPHDVAPNEHNLSIVKYIQCIMQSKIFHEQNCTSLNYILWQKQHRISKICHSQDVVI